jgi:hypothetical protein
LTTIYVRCKVLPGLFESELYVLINGTSAAYVTRNNVRKISATPKHGEQVDAQVLAYIINREETRSLIELPGEAVVGGLRTWVPNEMLTST